jgi:UDP-N-acetylglucosamine 2-epimerase (non-hydrolysing)
MIALVLGTRPEIIKVAPIIRHMHEKGMDYRVIHTGQHYSSNLDSIFFDRLSLPEPDFNLSIGSDTQSAQVGAMTKGIGEIFETLNPTCVIVQGDTNSTLSGALVASKRNTLLCHVEAGLRSYDRSMPEEVNRVITDHVSDLLFAPTDEAKENALREGIEEATIFTTGNTVVDSLLDHREIARKKSTILEDKSLKKLTFILLTLHRAENVDTKSRFESILRGVGQVARKLGTECLFPAHPRSVNRMNEFDVEVPPKITVTDPLDYLDFIVLQDQARLVLTDSGGVQEEACVLRTPCVTLRDNTERPETVTVGSNVVVGASPKSILDGALKMVDHPRDWANPYGDGKAHEQIVETISEHL